MSECKSKRAWKIIFVTAILILATGVTSSTFLSSLPAWMGSSMSMRIDNEVVQAYSMILPVVVIAAGIAVIAMAYNKRCVLPIIAIGMVLIALHAVNLILILNLYEMPLRHIGMWGTDWGGMERNLTEFYLPQIVAFLYSCVLPALLIIGGIKVRCAAKPKAAPAPVLQSDDTTSAE